VIILDPSISLHRVRFRQFKPENLHHFGPIKFLVCLAPTQRRSAYTATDRNMAFCRVNKPIGNHQGLSVPFAKTSHGPVMEQCRGVRLGCTRRSVVKSSISLWLFMATHFSALHVSLSIPMPYNPPYEHTRRSNRGFCSSRSQLPEANLFIAKGVSHFSSLKIHAHWAIQGSFPFWGTFQSRNENANLFPFEACD
jgi:hypothetical protein